MISRKEAIEAGLKFYFTGKPCKRGHIAERYVSNGYCVCCVAEKGKKYRQENKEKIAERMKKYSQENKERLAEWKKKHYQENKEKIAEQVKKYRQENKEKVAEQWKKYYQENKEKISEQQKKYRQDNKEYYYLQFKLRQKRLRKATPSWFESEVDEIKEVYLECKKLNDEAGYIKYHVDHVIPIKNKKVCGLHTISNLQIITAEENLSKNNKLLPQRITEGK